MHEAALIDDLVARIEDVAAAEGAVRVARIRVWVGALSHLTPEHFREHFEDGARGTVAEGAEVDVEVGTDPFDPSAQSIVLESIEVDEP